MSRSENKLAIREETLNGLRCVMMETEALVCGVLPDLGGKMAILTDKRSGREWLKSPNPSDYKLMGFDSKFVQSDRTGFGECFPTGGNLSYPFYPWKGQPVADHGEVWPIPWKAEKMSTGVRLTVHGVRFPYIFSREISPKGDTINLFYRAQNPSPCDLPVIWIGHGIMQLEEGMKIVIPKHETAYQGWKRDDKGRFLKPFTWPHVMTLDEKQTEDISVAKSRDLRKAFKVYITHLEEGYTALYEPNSGDFAGFSFSPKEVPHLGVFVTWGGFPGPEGRDYNVALEPTNGYPDGIEDFSEYFVVPAHGELRWSMQLKVGAAKSEGEVRDKLR